MKTGSAGFGSLLHCSPVRSCSFGGRQSLQDLSPMHGIRAKFSNLSKFRAWPSSPSPETSLQRPLSVKLKPTVKTWYVSRILKKQIRLRGVRGVVRVPVVPRRPGVRGGRPRGKCLHGGRLRGRATQGCSMSQTKRDLLSFFGPDSVSQVEPLLRTLLCCVPHYLMQFSVS